MSTPDIVEITAISDPGEVDREIHTRADRFVINFGNLVAWSFPLLMLCIVAQVILRGSGYNQAWLDDLQWWVYGFAMTTAIAYAITTNSHVRVDILHQGFDPKKQARIEAFALGWMLMPFLILMMDILGHYAAASIASGEGSDSPNGLHRLYLLKGSLPILFLVAIIAAWAALRRQLSLHHGDTWANRLLYAFPAFVFGLWRLLDYAVYWFVRLTDPEVNPRRIGRMEIFEYTLYIAFAVVLAALILAWVLGRGRRADGGAV